MTDVPLVLPLEAVDPTDPDTLGRVGGKAANLGALVRAGFAVPAGVCLTTAAYRQAVGSALDALLAEGTDAAGLAGKARAAVLAVPIPDEVADAVRATCPDGPVAVRSSATAEDLPGASFAGQQDTFLNVVGDDAVLDAVRRCWASLWTDRAVAYRGAQGIDHAAVTLAVVIQSMVDARWAGVLFTADPVTGRRGQAVIDAAPGLGESVVSGSVDPEHVVVEPGGEIVSRHAGAGGTVVRALPGGGTETVAHPSGAGSLDDADVQTLARLGRRVEALFGAPQDIEWALDGDGRAWLTQSRPITTLYPLVPGRPGLRLFLSANVAQGVFRPFTPAGLSAARHLASGVAGLLGVPVDDPEQGPPMLSEAGERVFVDLTDVLRSRLGRAGAAGVLGVMETRSAEVIATQLDRPELAVTRRSPLPTVRRVGRIALRYRIPPAVVGAWTNPARARDRAFDLVRTAGEALPARPEAGRVERVERVRWMLTDRFVRVPRGPPRPRRPASSPSAWPPACSAVAPVPASSAPYCAACRTTSPRRWTSRSGTSPSACATTPPPSPLSPGPRPPSSPGSAAPGPRCSPRGSAPSSPRTAAAPSPRSTSACRAGPTTPPTCSGCSPTTCVSTTPGARRTSCSPAAPRRPRRRSTR
ncbi:PEP/pyruvate-binding domain-containing protein [Actinomycetospora sp. CA-053990]|uniref:PEP/pyruvate-binding domain-containing protein n=1 Tax=Actinomycetospora sp. CA-053990 TaxID=3239891 RepID=UPI003D8A97B4